MRAFISSEQFCQCFPMNFCIQPAMGLALCQVVLIFAILKVVCKKKKKVEEGGTFVNVSVTPQVRKS